MRRIPLALALFAALAVPAVAEPTKATTPEQGATRAHKGNLFTEEQARVHLAKQGYESISGLEKDENGGWRGTAVRDGKPVGVAVNVQGQVDAD